MIGTTAPYRLIGHVPVSACVHPLDAQLERLNDAGSGAGRMRGNKYMGPPCALTLKQPVEPGKRRAKGAKLNELALSYEMSLTSISSLKKQAV
jgi:hypothetical protein